MAEDLGGRLLGQVAWDGSIATSERVLLRATVANRRLVERNRYVRIQPVLEPIAPAGQPAPSSLSGRADGRKPQRLTSKS